GAVLALPAPAIAQEKERSGQADPAQGRSADKQTAKTEKAKWTVKAFDLKHRNAEELSRVLMGQWNDPARIAPQGVAVVIGPSGYPVRVGVPQPVQPAPATRRTSSYRGSDDHLLVSFDPQAKLFFVRGPEAEVRAAETLIKALDVPNGQLKQVEFDGMHLIPVRQDKLQQVTQTLSNLRISNQTTTLGNAAFVVIHDETKDGGIVEQARTVIAKYGAGMNGTSTPEKSGTTPATEKPEKPER
ncbi:MAG TPA: hypothetical protein VFG68_09205, partial [Fimbriiglobus sp.]|nr:hypothetical protein [Fimbriiglobus sp.]